MTSCFKKPSTCDTDELLAKLEGPALQVNHLAEPVAGTGGMRPTTSKSKATVQDGSLWVDLSPGETIRVPPFTLEGTRLRFEPPTLTWMGEDELELQVLH